MKPDSSNPFTDATTTASGSVFRKPTLSPKEKIRYQWDAFVTRRARTIVADTQTIGAIPAKITALQKSATDTLESITALDKAIREAESEANEGSMAALKQLQHQFAEHEAKIKQWQKQLNKKDYKNFVAEHNKHREQLGLGLDDDPARLTERFPFAMIEASYDAIYSGETTVTPEPLRSAMGFCLFVYSLHRLQAVAPTPDRAHILETLLTFDPLGDSIAQIEGLIGRLLGDEYKLNTLADKTKAPAAIEALRRLFDVCGLTQDSARPCELGEQWGLEVAVCRWINRELATAVQEIPLLKSVDSVLGILAGTLKKVPFKDRIRQAVAAKILADGPITGNKEALATTLQEAARILQSVVAVAERPRIEEAPTPVSTEAKVVPGPAAPAAGAGVRVTNAALPADALSPQMVKIALDSNATSSYSTLDRVDSPASDHPEEDTGAKPTTPSA